MRVPRWELLEWGEETLKNAGISDWKTDAWLLFEYVTKMNRTKYFLCAKDDMPEDEAERYREGIHKRLIHIPLQHITGVQEFMGLGYMVNEHVLVPRMDTEILVQTVEQYVRDEDSILDMCTGSGCIAISLKKRNESLEVSAADISPDALHVAAYNAEHLDAKVKLYQSDLFESLRKTEIFGQLPQFNVIVSNPPYIPSEVVDGLEPEVRDHEPRIALDGTEDGLEFYRRITRECKPFLCRDGMLFYEIGHDQGDAVRQIMEEEGFINVNVVQDLAGLDRVVYGGIGNV